MLFPLQNITYVLTRSLFPILSRMQNDKIECNNIYINTVKSIVLIVTPLMFGLASIGYEFVPLVFGAQWRDVASLLIWLAPTAVLQSQISTTGAVFMSQGRTSVLLWLTIFNAFLQIGAFIVGSLYDINTIVILYFAANLVMYFPNMLFAVSVLGGSFLSLLKSISLPILFGILMFASLLYIKPYILFFMNLNPNSITFLIIQIFLGFLIYTMLILIFERDDLRRFRGSLRKRNNIL